MAKRKKRLPKKDKKRSRGLGIKPAVFVSLIQIAFFGAAGLLLVSFSRQGALLIRLNDMAVGYFGWTAIFLPFILLATGFLFSKVNIPLGQPNVIIGSLLFHASIATLTSAGDFGRSAWEGVAALVTGAGAFVVLTGTTLVGLVVLFNTSVDQFLLGLAKILRGVRSILVGDRGLPKKPQFDGRRELKILGGNQLLNDNKKWPETPRAAEPSVPTPPVANSPGDQKVWNYPGLDLLSDATGGRANRGDIKGNAAVIEQTLESFGITARVVEVNQGPAVTQYAIEVALGTKLTKITALERDLALALAAPTGTIRIEAPIPGRSLVGIELPNISPEFVPLKSMLAHEEMKDRKEKLAIPLGLDVSGKPVVVDIESMPHVLIAGQTGSGKSVAINSILATVLFRASPNEVKFILVDPKRVELTGYNDIPHLLSPVIVEPGKVISALKWLIAEMDRRYKIFAQAGARNIAGYNDVSGFQALPHIVLVIDELADVMMFSPVEVEEAVTRLAQMSRATGIHMVLATQRPSVDVITGLIKANIPARIAFAVASQVDSRVILDTQGAEKLLGRGDMLYLSPREPKPSRIQGAFIEDRDISSLVQFIRGQGIAPQYTEEVMEARTPGQVEVAGLGTDMDDKFREAVDLVVQFDRASASLIQRRLSVGYARAARILDQLEVAGVVGPADGSKPRDVLVRSAEEIFGSQAPVEAEEV